MMNGVKRRWPLLRQAASGLDADGSAAMSERTKMSAIAQRVLDGSLRP